MVDTTENAQVVAPVARAANVDMSVNPNTVARIPPSSGSL